MKLEFNGTIQDIHSLLMFVYECKDIDEVRSGVLQEFKRTEALYNEQLAKNNNDYELRKLANEE